MDGFKIPFLPPLSHPSEEIERERERERKRKKAT
jgi:hypothetical protein